MRAPLAWRTGVTRFLTYFWEMASDLVSERFYKAICDERYPYVTIEWKCRHKNGLINASEEWKRKCFQHVLSVMNPCKSHKYIRKEFIREGFGFDPVTVQNIFECSSVLAHRSWYVRNRLDVVSMLHVYQSERMKHIGIGIPIDDDLTFDEKDEYALLEYAIRSGFDVSPCIFRAIDHRSKRTITRLCQEPLDLYVTTRFWTWKKIWIRGEKTSLTPLEYMMYSQKCAGINDSWNLDNLNLLHVRCHHITLMLLLKHGCIPEDLLRTLLRMLQ